MQHSVQIHNPMIYVGLSRRSRRIYLLNALSDKDKALWYIMRSMTKSYGITRVELSSKSRQSPLPDLRTIFIHNAIKNTPFSLAEVSSFINLKSHASSIHHLTKYDNLYNSDLNFRRLADKFQL